MPAYFITATGTGIGKTLMTCAFAYQAHNQGKQVRALKPVISGFDQQNPQESDTGQILQSLGRAITLENIEQISPWRFAAPLSPDMAARQEGRNIQFADIVKFCQQAAALDPDLLLIEGVGGVMTPLTNTRTVLDLIVALQIPVILVTGSYVGTLSHTLTAVHALTSNHISIHRLIISESEDGPPLEETKSSLKNFIKNMTIQTLPRLEAGTEPWKRVISENDLKLE